MKYRTLLNKMLVKPLDGVRKTPTGLVIPESAKSTYIKAKIVTVGPGFVDDRGQRVPTGVKPGDVAYFTRENYGELDGFICYADVHIIAVEDKEINNEKKDKNDETDICETAE